MAVLNLRPPEVGPGDLRFSFISFRSEGRARVPLTSQDNLRRTQPTPNTITLDLVARSENRHTKSPTGVLGITKSSGFKMFRGFLKEKVHSYQFQDGRQSPRAINFSGDP